MIENNSQDKVDEAFDKDFLQGAAQSLPVRLISFLARTMKNPVVGLHYGYCVYNF